MMCFPELKLGVISAIFCAGWCMTLLWLPRLGDIWGRKWMIVCNNFIGILLYIFLLKCQMLKKLSWILLAWGMFNSCRMNIGYMYLLELMP